MEWTDAKSTGEGWGDTQSLKQSSLRCGTRLVGTAPSPDVMELAWWAPRPGCLQAGRLVNTPGTPSLVVVRPGRASLRSP